MLLGTNRYNFLVVANANSPLVTAESLELLKTVGAVRRLDLMPYPDANERNRVFDDVLRDTDAIISAPWGHQGIPTFITERLDIAHKLKVISGTYDYRIDGWLDVAEAKRRGITVIDTSRSMTPTVAEFALTMMLNLLRDIPHEIDLMRQGKWSEGWYDIKGFVAGDLSGRRVGLAGFGSICRNLSKLLMPFRCDMHAYDPYVSDDTLHEHNVIRANSLEELAAWSEIFVVGIPLMPPTIKIINSQVIDAMPRGSLFVLVTRMAVVDQEPLWRRTSAGEIRAAIDVYDPEPPPSDSPIRTNPNILPTPHIAGNTATAHRRCFVTACEEALSALTGKPLRYEVSIRDTAMYAGK
jgi:phosphoglycerate dehydrogenase-like enzyme